MPQPPAAREPPPKNANVAFVAAAPLREAIAVPVDAQASAWAAPYAPKAASAPLAVPATLPPARGIAKLQRFLSSTKSCASMCSLLSSFNPSVFRKSTFFSFVKVSRNCVIFSFSKTTFLSPRHLSASLQLALCALIISVDSATI